MKARRWLFPALAVYVYLAAFTWTYDSHAAPRLQGKSMGGGFAPMQASGSGGRRPSGGTAGPKVPFARIKRVHGGYSVEYGFKNFNGDIAQVSAELDAEAVADSIKEYGFKPDEFAKLDGWYKKAQDEAVAEAEEKYVKGEVKANSREELDQKVKFINDINKKVAAGLEVTLANLSKEYRRKRQEVYTKAGFRFQDAKTIEADIPGMAKRNWKRVRPLAQAFARLSEEKSYDAEDLVGGVVAMVQTALRYEVPEDKEGSRVIGGAYPPPQTLILGQGDCDTKTAVIASILLSWPNVKMVGLAIPGHYLMAYHRIPRSGDVFMEYQGLQYVMIESAGPAWIPPGTVGDQTQAYLDSGRDFRIQPITL